MWLTAKACLFVLVGAIILYPLFVGWETYQSEQSNTYLLVIPTSKYTILAGTHSFDTKEP